MVRDRTVRGVRITLVFPLFERERSSPHRLRCRAGRIECSGRFARVRSARASRAPQCACAPCATPARTAEALRVTPPASGSRRAWWPSAPISGKSPSDRSPSRTSRWLTATFCNSEATARYGAGLRACALTAARSAAVTPLCGCELMPHSTLKHAARGCAAHF